MTVGEMKSDLGPVFSLPADRDLARGISRQVIVEIASYYASRIEHFDRMKLDCTDCRFRAGTYCKHFQESPPKEYDGSDCDSWQWDGIPF